MALIWAEGFDHYGNGTTGNGGRDYMLAGAWAQFSAGNGNLPDISANQARTGSHSLRIAYNSLATDSVRARRVLGASEIVVGCAAGVYYTGLPNVNGSFGWSFRNNANENIAFIIVQSDGAIGVQTGNSYTLIGASDPVITANSWQHIEAKIVCDTVVGEVEVRVNGVTVLHFTDINLGSLGCTQITFGQPHGKQSASSLTMYYDDIVTWNDTGDSNNDFIGAQRVHTFFADADTAQADWTKVGDTDGFDCIDNSPPDGDTTYLLAEDEGDISEFELPTLPPETESIIGVFIPLMGRLEDAGTGNVQASLVSGSDVSEGPEHTLTTAYTYWFGMHELDPATGNPWSKASLEAAKLRLEKTV